MIPKTQRGLSPKEISVLVKTGKRRSYPWGTVYWTSRQRTLSTRIAVVVGRRVARSAVVRNRKRRIVQAAIRPLLPRLSPPRDLVIIWRTEGVRTPSPDDLRVVFEQLFF